MAVLGIFIWGLQPMGLGTQVPQLGPILSGGPVGVLPLQGLSPDGGLGQRSSLQTLFTDFDCRNDQNLKIVHNSCPDS